MRRARVLPGAPRKQLHQPGLSRRAAGDVPARSARSGRGAAGVPGDPANTPACRSSRRSPSSRADVGIVTLAPELPGGIDLVRALVGGGPSRVAGSFRGRLRDGDGRDRRRRAPRDAPVQPDDAARPPRARPGRRGAARDEVTRRAHLRRLSRASGDVRAWRSPRRGRRTSWRSPTAPPAPACRSARRRRSAGGRFTSRDDGRVSRRRHAGRAAR